MDDSTLKAAKAAVDKLKEDPSLVHAPELNFFKDYIESLGGSVPKVEKKKDDGHGHGGHSGHGGNGHKEDNGHGHDDGCCDGHGHGDKEEHGHGHKEEHGHGHKEEHGNGHAEGGCCDEDHGKGHGDEEPEEPVEPEIPEDPESDDPDRLPEDAEPFPEKSPGNELDLTDEQLDKQGELKQAAAEAMEDGDMKKALDKFTEAIKIGNVSAMMYAKRADMLLKMKKPCASISDCDAALEINPDSAKAYRIRGKARRLIGKWEDAHKDIALAQKLDFDDGVMDLQEFLNKKHKKIQDRLVKVRAREERIKLAEMKRRKAKAQKEYEEFDKKRAAEQGMGGGYGGMPGGMGGMPGGMPAGFDPSMFANMFGGKGGGKGGMPEGFDPSMFANMFGGGGGGGIDPSMFANMAGGMGGMGGKGGGKGGPPETSGPTVEEVSD